MTTFIKRLERKGGSVKVTEYFDALYVIYLPHRVERVASMRHELKAIEADPDRTHWFVGKQFADSAGFPRAAVRGCVMSFRAVFGDALAKGHARILVLQEDCVFTRRFALAQGPTLAELGSLQWDMAYIGHGSPDAAGPACFTPTPHDEGMMLTHCCAYTARAMQAVCDLIDESLTRQPGDPAGGPMYFDGYMTTMRGRHPELATCRATRSLAWQHASASSLTPHWWDGVPLLAPAAGAMRIVKAAWQRRMA